ncbi:MAG: FRG domain-containing protein [Janthinobacterium lividum]
MADDSDAWIAPPSKSMPGGFDEWEATDVNAAVLLASQFKRSGRYKIFRGQRNANWPILSSFARMDEAGRRTAQQDLCSFYKWARSAPDVVPYLQEENAIIAAAQHHGVCATNFIDFTRNPNVAGWFATDGALTGDRGAIFMIDPDVVASVFAAFSQPGLIIRFLDIEVKNLWRLQAQSGLFLESQTSVDLIWPFDRITFPHTKATLNIERRMIYPNRRSHLEQMIDLYNISKSRMDVFKTLIAGNAGILHISLDDPPDVTFELPRNPLPAYMREGPHEAWSDMDIDTSPPMVSFHEISKEVIDLSTIIHRRRLSTDLMSASDAPDLRNGPFQKQLDDLWEGMRPHPYDDKHIAVAIISLSRLYPVLGAFPLDKGLGPDRVASEILDSPLEIEMGLIGAGTTRACVSTLKLWSAMTTAGQDFTGTEGEPSVNEMKAILHRFSGRTIGLFNPKALLDLFATEIVPWQIAVRRPIVVFWPSHIASLGIP